MHSICFKFESVHLQWPEFLETSWIFFLGGGGGLGFLCQVDL